jgi:hypothetical protein
MPLRRSLGLLGLGGAALLGIGLLAGSRGDSVEDARAPAPIVFVCRNGVAMSVWSAAYFNRLAAERGLRERAVARAALPTFREVPLRMRLALALDGFRLDGFRPKVVDAEDARSAAWLVAIDTELPVVGEDGRVERWQGFPPMRERYFPARAALRQRVEALVARLAADGPR